MAIETAASYLDWPKQRLYKLSASGELPHYKHEGRHARPSITLDTYTHLFDRAAHAADIRERMAPSTFGGLLTGDASS